MLRPVLTGLLAGSLAALLLLAGVQPAAAVTRSDEFVKAKATADKPTEDGTQVITLTLSVEKGFHTYANPLPKEFPGVATTVKVAGKVKPEDVKVEYPKGKFVKDKDAGDH